MGDFACEASGGRLTAAHVGPREEAVVYWVGEPILFLTFSGYWRCDHVIVYAERQPPIAHDCLEAITFAKELSLTKFLDKVWAALNEHDNTLVHE